MATNQNVTIYTASSTLQNTPSAPPFSDLNYLPRSNYINPKNRNKNPMNLEDNPPTYEEFLE